MNLNGKARRLKQDNDINTDQGSLRLKVWNRLSNQEGGSDTAWMTMDTSYNQRDKGLNIFMRVNPEIKSEVELETGVRKYVGYMRFAEGFTDFRGVYHSVGTGQQKGVIMAQPTSQLTRFVGPVYSGVSPPTVA